MAWHDESPWRSKRKAAVQTATDRLADLEKKLSTGDISPAMAVTEAFNIGIEEGRANPVITRIGTPHTPEVQT
jgi:hypothetical protein